jgi:hypothetical protein
MTNPKTIEETVSKYNWSSDKDYQIAVIMLKQYKADLSTIVRDARIDELRLFKCRTANIKDGTSWDKWDKRISDNIESRIKELKAKEHGLEL